MNHPQNNLINLIDKFTKSNIDFALYQLPNSNECNLVLQLSKNTENINSFKELNDKNGFIMTPFILPNKNSTILIKPEIIAHNWKEIENIFDSITFEKTNEENDVVNHIDNNIENQKSEEIYSNSFLKFISSLQKGEHKKLVLSRKKSITTEPSFSPATIFLNACNNYPNMMTYLCHTTCAGTWIGSTPELILENHKDEWHTVALAGTMGCESREWSQKNIDEQKCVSDCIRDNISTLSSQNTIREKGPYTARAGKLLHLKSDFFFINKENIKFGDILNNLHPTPAICGFPKDSAIEFIKRHEGYDRKYYCGIIGIVDKEKEINLYINLRCMEINKDNVNLYAGGGIMPSSTFDQELDETDKKLETMNRLIFEN